MDNSQDKQAINKAAVALIASQVFVRSAVQPDSTYSRDAKFSLQAAETFVEALAELGYDPGTLLTSGGLL